MDETTKALLRARGIAARMDRIMKEPAAKTKARMEEYAMKTAPKAKTTAPKEQTKIAPKTTRES